MVFVEDGAGAVFDVVRCEDCDAVLGEFGGEGGAAVVVLQGGDAWGDFCLLVRRST